MGRRTAGAGITLAATLLFKCGCTLTTGIPTHELTRSDGDGSENVATAAPAEHPVLDRLERVIDAPLRLLPAQADAPQDSVISPETLALVQGYLDQHGLVDVRIAVNEYAPRENLKRIRDNKSIAPGWRYPAGGLAWLRTTLVPDRLLDRNRFDPYTRTLVLCSDRPFEILAEAARARQLVARPAPDWVTVASGVPPLVFIARWSAASEALEYARAAKDENLEETGYRELYPEVTTTAALVFAPFLPWYATPMLAAGGQVIGWGAAELRIRNRNLETVATAAELPTDGTPPPASPVGPMP